MGDAVSFRVWAPAAQRVHVVVEGAREAFELCRDAHGYFEGTAPGIEAGALYRYRVDGQGPYPDPCSRFQPHGPHGPSQVIDPAAFAWRDAQWRGRSLEGQVIYELHIGTFTSEGTFDAAVARLDHLVELGIGVVELMPVAECAGRWNWGYDGVALFAPYHVYGEPDACRRFVDAAHTRGLAVLLDVVYNHLGPDGNYLPGFSPHYFSEKYRTEWGEPLNFDGEHANGARDFVIGNACYWVREFHMDGFRLDATQSIFDASKPHVIAELIEAARAAAGPRQLIIVAENEPQRAEHLLPPSHGGMGIDAMWNDDFHHSARVALTGSRDGYYFDYTGAPQELVSAVKRGFLYQGQFYAWQKKHRGSPLPRRWRAASLVTFLQNHDQVANTSTGVRCIELASAARLRALTALLLLAPQTPLLFMGQEFGSRQPFMFFADHRPELAARVHAGRREFIAQFRAEASAQAQRAIPAPDDERTFTSSKLDWRERETGGAWLRLHRDLLRLRRADPVIARQDVNEIDGAVLSETAFVLRWWDERAGDRLLLINIGKECLLTPAPEPLLAAPRDAAWSLVWSSDDIAYGGRGAVAPSGAAAPGWRLTADSAVLLQAEPTPAR